MIERVKIRIMVTTSIPKGGLCFTQNWSAEDNCKHLYWEGVRLPKCYAFRELLKENESGAVPKCAKCKESKTIP